MRMYLKWIVSRTCCPRFVWNFRLQLADKVGGWKLKRMFVAFSNDIWRKSEEKLFAVQREHQSVSKWTNFKPTRYLSGYFGDKNFKRIVELTINLCFTIIRYIIPPYIYICIFVLYRRLYEKPCCFRLIWSCIYNSFWISDTILIMIINADSNYFLLQASGGYSSI